MEDPIKVIFRYKNNNKKIQHHIYIFIGNLIPKETKIILEKIKNKDLNETFLQITDKENKILVKQYGEYWYEKFFNSRHINFTKANIKNNASKTKQIIDKFGKDWYQFHFVERDLTARKITYSFESLIKDQKEKLNFRKLKDIGKDDEDIDYTTTKKKTILYFNNKKINRQVFTKTTDSEGILNSIRTSEKSYIDNLDINTIESMNDSINTIQDHKLKQVRYVYKEYKKTLKNQITLKKTAIENLQKKSLSDLDINGVTMGTLYNSNIQNGGNDENYKENEENKDDDDDDIDDVDNIAPKKIKIEEQEDLELEDIEALYKNVDVRPDENIQKTTNMIQKALDDNKLFDKINKQLIVFDQSKDTSQFDEDLKNVYEKIYVTSQYIFKDDTIKIIKDKICCSIKNNKKFDNNTYLIPSRQYLWSEYYYGKNIEKVMIGQKWLKKNELLNIDIEPNQNIRVYESLRGNLKALKRNLKRYGSKIKYEDDEYNILLDYEDYFIANEIFLADVYNEIGLNFESNKEEIQNLIDVYFKIYYPKIRSDDIKNVLNFLKNDKETELLNSKNIFDTINNDLVLINEITNEIETTKKNSIDYKDIFKDSYITQSVIHVVLRNLDVEEFKPIIKDKMALTVKKQKQDKNISLFRLFDNFIIDNDYPFVQYQTIDGNINFKFNNKNLLETRGERDVLTNWFENAPYGITFKLKILDKKGTVKYMSINLHENGRIEYKTQWKEEDMARIEDIVDTYDYVKKLVRKLNSENKKINLEIPNNDDFKFAFINTIQKFILPKKFIINHNDLSNFSRYFFPYIALVIEPRKRKSKKKKEEEKGKYGTYLRYKRVSKYENQTRLEYRILYFIKNYEYSDASLANEISKQFNITIENATEEIKNVKKKYPNIKKSRKILKKLENIPKYPTPGIDIDIQGKKRDNYKIRISGARNKKQLERILTFMNLLLFLYTETYHFKKPEKQKLKNKLKLLTNIAKRRRRVEEIVDYETETKNVKKMALLDKKRIGFKPEKGQNQWTRNCQNSGDDKKRRPQQYTDQTIKELLKNGYYLNKDTNQYEKKIKIKKGSKKKETVIRTVKLKSIDGTNNVYYGCNPEENGEHMHIGFLTRSNNPFGHCMPCCFKKDFLLSNNKNKKDYYLKCIGKKVEQKKEKANILGDKLYILQDTNKIQEGRIGFLPKYLDIFMNLMLKKEKTIKNHYLTVSKTGYYFKYGIKQDFNLYLNAISTFFEKNIDYIIKAIINVLKKDKDNIIFTSLNNGDIRTQFNTRQNYIDFIQSSDFIDYDIVNDILSIPGTLYKDGLNIIIFQKKIYVIKTELDKEKTKEDYVILCHNMENIDNLIDTKRKNLILLKENNKYYPIIMVSKQKESDKDIKLVRTFEYQDTKDNIINHILEYYKLNCSQKILNQIYLGYSIIGKNLAKILNSLDKKFHVKNQVIDSKNKCIYFLTNNNTLVPVKPSGIIYYINIQNDLNLNLLSFKEQYENLLQLYEISKKTIKTKPIGVYIEKQNRNIIKVIAIKTISNRSVPIKHTNIERNKIEKMNLVIENKSTNDVIDVEIKKGQNNKLFDERTKQVNLNNYLDEGYQLFRLEVSDYLKENESFTNKLEKIIINDKINKNDKRNLIKKMMYKITSKELYEIFINNFNLVGGYNIDIQEGGSNNFIHILDNEPDIKNYKFLNNRDLCASNLSKNTCDVNIHCKWNQNICKFALTYELLINYVNRISEEFLDNSIKKQELFQYNKYFVSDIVNYNSFIERPQQKIIKSDNRNVKKILEMIFGKEMAPIIGKRRKLILDNTNSDQLNIDNPLRDMGEYFSQNIINNKNSVYRAFANCLFWKKNNLFDVSHRNLGFYSELQTDLSNYFKSIVIDWLLDKKNQNEIKNNLLKYIDSSKIKKFKKDFVMKLSTDVHTLTNCVVELYILSKKYNNVLYVYNENNDIKYIFDNEIVYDININKKYANKYDDNNLKKDSLHIRLNFISKNINPDKIDVLYIKNNKKQ